MCLHFETVTAKTAEPWNIWRSCRSRPVLSKARRNACARPTHLDFWRPVGIYDGTELVGFAMYGYLPFLGEGQLWF